jgi:shikimate kinase
MPGGGKSTVGRQLARHLNVQFVDSDNEIERRVGCSIKAFFERAGETEFREIEREVVAELIRRKDIVVATGGGVVLSETNRAALHDGAHVVYLRSTPEELFRRLRHDTRRPLLQVPDPLRKLRQLYAERDPLYRRTAHFVIETGRPSVSTLVSMILMQLELAGVIDPDRVPSPVPPRAGD